MFFDGLVLRVNLASESVESSALSFQSVDNIESSNSLPLSVLGVGNGISDNVLQENFEDASGLFVDQSGDSLDTTSSRQSSNGWLGDTLDVISKDFSVPFGASFSKTFTAFTSSRHFGVWFVFRFTVLKVKSEWLVRFRSGIYT